MCITRRRDKPVPSYNVNNTTLETCDSFRLLGVTVSSDLSWNCHVNNITKKCNKLLGFIRVVAGVKNPYVLLKLYQTLICQFLITAHLFGMFTRIVMWKNWNKSSTVPCNQDDPLST